MSRAIVKRPRAVEDLVDYYAYLEATKSGRAKSVGRDHARGLSQAGSKIVAALEEATAMMRAGEPMTARTYAADFTPPDYGPNDVRRVRALLEMSQVVFARFLGVDPNTVRSWEQGTRSPSPIARRFLGEIESDPTYWRRRIAERAQGC